MHEHPRKDPHTGIETYVTGPGFPERRRTPCAGNNRRRARGFAEVLAEAQRIGKAPVDGQRAIADTAREHGLPLVDPSTLGIQFDDHGQWTSDFLIPLKGGAEAHPFLDSTHGVVYKLFDLRPDGGLGKKLVLCPGKPQWNLEIKDATALETIEKLCILHEAGAHPTEITASRTPMTDSWRFFKANASTKKGLPDMTPGNPFE